MLLKKYKELEISLSTLGLLDTKDIRVSFLLIFRKWWRDILSINSHPRNTFQLVKMMYLDSSYSTLKMFCQTFITYQHNHVFFIFTFCGIQSFWSYFLFCYNKGLHKIISDTFEYFFWFPVNGKECKETLITYLLLKHSLFFYCV